MSHLKPSSLNQAASNLLAALIEENTVKPPPMGAMMAVDFARKTGRGIHAARALLESSKLRRGKFRTPQGNLATFYY